ncbi:MAG: hypothetical protein CMH27_08100 [Micavibrio sp.]|nr:hypothetical protein [Micavibrio sp.]
MRTIRSTQTTNRNRKNSRGFTLIEMAVALMIIGLIMAPAIASYSLYKTKEKIDHTSNSMDRVQGAISGYLQTHGRYPCPAALDLDSTDVQYGYENCAAAAPSVYTATSQNPDPLLTNKNVLIGTIPFRTLNLEEDDMIDGYHSRLTYAVTEMLTDAATYEHYLGGLDIVDANGDTAITPQYTAHYIVISHGQDNSGANTLGGALVGTCAAAPVDDRENCDHTDPATIDATFVATAKSNDYDDKVLYMVGRSVTPWQYRSGNLNDIHLRRGDTLVAGEMALSTAALASFDSENLHIRMNAPSDGILSATRTPDQAAVADYQGNGLIASDAICDGGGTYCFAPIDLGGDYTAPVAVPPTANADGTLKGVQAKAVAGNSGGVACTDDNVMIGMENGLPVCAEEVEFNCPAGTVVRGIKDGQIMCDAAAPPACGVETVTTSCGTSANLAGVASSGVSVAFSGECHYMDVSLNTTTLDSLVVAGDLATTKTNIQGYLDAINNDPASRSSADCSLVRDAYECTSGAFDPTPIATIEKLRISTAWPSDKRKTTNQAETITGASYEPYVPATPMSADPNQTSYQNDCWCREDYRMRESSCTSGVGSKLVIEETRCPATDTDWFYAGWTTGNDFCGCTAVTGAKEAGPSCADFFGIPTESVTGTVMKVYDVTCSPYTKTYRPQAQWDISDCRCPAQADKVPDPSPAACPSGQTNSFTFEGESYTAKSKVEHKRWVCPTGVGGPVANAGQGGYWNTTQKTETCVCDASVTGSQTISCASYKDPKWGGNVKLKTEVDCSTMPPTMNLVSPPVELPGSECYQCAWKASGSPSIDNAPDPAGFPENNPCNCNTDTVSTCTRVDGAGYDVYNNCQCKRI